MSTDPWVDGFRSLELRGFIEEISSFLRDEGYPDYSSILFCRDEDLNRERNSVPLYKEIFDIRNSSISPSIFFSDMNFEEAFSEIRNSGFDWIHVKIHGVLNKNLLVSIVTPGIDRGAPPENVGMRLFSLERQPPWELKD